MSISQIKKNIYSDANMKRVNSSMPKLQESPKEIKRSHKNYNFLDKYLTSENDELDDPGKGIENNHGNQYIDINMQLTENNRGYPEDNRNLSSVSSVARQISASAFDRTPLEIQVQYLKQELNEKRREIKLLTKTVCELKSKLYENLNSARSSCGENSVLSVIYSDIRGNALEKEIEQLRFNNKELMKRNTWLMKRVSEQGKSINLQHNSSELINSSRISKELPPEISPIDNSNSEKKLLSNRFKKKEPSTVQQFNYSDIANQIDKLSVSVFRHFDEPSFQEMTQLIFKEALFYVPAEAYVANYAVNDETRTFMTISPEYFKKEINYAYPNNFKNVEIHDLQRKLMKNLDVFREPWITKEHITLPIRVLTENGLNTNSAGLITFYKPQKSTCRDYQPYDKMFLKMLALALSFLVATCKERNKIKVLTDTYKSFAENIPEIVKSTEISQLLIKIKLCSLNVFKCEEVGLLVWDKVEDCFVSVSSGASLQDLKDSIKKKKPLDLNRFTQIIGISGKVYSDGEMTICDKPRQHNLFLNEIDNLSPLKFLERCIYIRLETSNKEKLGVLQIINKKKDISDKRFEEIVGPITEMISNVLYVALSSYRNNSIIQNMQDELIKVTNDFELY